jgi:hypothetical protein
MPIHVRRLAPLAACVAALSVLGTGSARPTHRAVAFTHVSVLPMDTDRVMRDQTVITRDDRIVFAGPAASARVPDEATVVDGRGSYLMPGLTDMHVHVHEPEELLSDLVWGVTTVASYSGNQQTLRWRHAVDDGTMVGPTIYTTAPIIDGVPPINSTHIEVATPAEAKTVVDFEKDAGYDFVKVYNNVSPAVYHAILTEAKARDIIVAGHIARQVGAEESLRAGQKVIAHAEEFYFTYFRTKPDTAKVPAIVAATKAADAWVVAMLSSTPDILGLVANIDSAMTFPEARYLPPAIFEAYRPANNGYVHRPDPVAFVARNRVMGAFLPMFVKALSDARVNLLVGTDATSLNFPGWAVHVEIRDLVNAGLSPFQALVVATRNAGTFVSESVRRSDHFGVVKAGMRADLILLAANPVADIANLDSLRGVEVRGVWRPIAELRRLRDSAAAPYDRLKRQVARFDSLVTASDIRGARSVFDSAVATDGGEPPFHEYQLYDDGLDLLPRDPAGALVLMRMAVQLYPYGFETHNGLARALLANHDTAGATAEFTTAARLAPGNDVSARMLDSLRRP